MKKINSIYKAIAAFSLMVSLQASAQAPFPASEYLDVNLFKAAHMVHGDMWWDPATSQPSCEYPKGTGKHASFLGSLWVSGKDNAGKLYVSAQLYRSDVDYWPGPLDATGSITISTSTDWAKIWKINASDIVTYLALPAKTVGAIPTVILQWPAKGNPYARGNAGAFLTISGDMAPFVDTDGDGLYDPTKGDYPKMKGDQMLWWVFNDNGPRHDASNGTPLKVEFKAMAYAYNRGGDVDRMMFYEFTMTNKSTERYNDFRFGVFSDADLGYAFDDYIAFDSSHRMGIEYNAKNPDGPNGANSYGAHPPLTGFSFVEMPGDIFPSAMLPTGSFNFYNNVFSGPLRDPSIDTEFNHYMHGKDANGTPRYFGNYAYSTTLGAVMCDSNLAAADRRYIISSGDYAFQPNTVAKIGMIFMATDTSGNACGSINFKELTDIADTAWKIYYNPLPSLSNREIALAVRGFELYPNPAESILYLSAKNTINPKATLRIVDALGRTMNLPILQNNKGYEISISSLASGLYSVVYSDDEKVSSQTFVKK